VGGTLYAGTYPNGNVFKSTDGGTTWTNTGNLAGATSVYDVLDVGGTLSVGTSPNGDVFNITPAKLVNPNHSDAEYKVLDHCDVIGDPANYDAKWLAQGHAGSALLWDEEGNSVLPADVANDATYTNCKIWKLSRKYSGGGHPKAVVVRQGTSYTLFTPGSGFGNVDANANYAATDSASNTLCINWTGLDDSAVIEVFYETEAKFTESANKAVSLAMFDKVQVRHHNSSNALPLNILDKVSTSTITSDYADSKTVSGHTISTNKMLNDDSSNVPSHDPLVLGEGDGNTLKTLPYLTRENGKAFVQMVYKEMKFDVDWGDDSTFQIISQEDVLTDDNGNQVLYGQHRFELPYFMPESE